MQLNDPESAQFRNLELAGDAVCGEVNAKNGFGGYVGFQPFYALGSDVLIHSPTGDELIDGVSTSEIRLACLKAESGDT